MTKTLFFRSDELEGKTVIPITIENGIWYIAIDPIFNLLAIDCKKQFKIIERDPCLGKQFVRLFYGGGLYPEEILFIPASLIFGFLYSIKKPRNHPKENWQQLRFDLYQFLYHHFIEQHKFELYKEKEIETLKKTFAELKMDFQKSESFLMNKIDEFQSLTFQDYKNQLLNTDNSND